MWRVPAVVGAVLLVTLAGTGHEPALAQSTFVETALTASDGAAGDTLGASIAISGNTLVVGAPRDDVGANADQGSAYVFTRSLGVWSQQARLTAADGAAGDLFGTTVAISGDTIVVGAPYDDHLGLPDPYPYTGADLGSVYVFMRSAGVWSQEARLTPIDVFDATLFGMSVAISGNTVVVGIPFANEPSATYIEVGSANIFTRSAGVWSPDARLTPGDLNSFSQFGTSVAISEDAVVVGAPHHDGAGGPFADTGSAYVFTSSAGVWSQQVRLNASDAGPAHRFGQSVGISGNTVVVGAPLHEDYQDPGRAYVFTLNEGVWSPQTLTASDGAAVDTFGNTVAIDGDSIVVGALLHDVDGNLDQGSAYVFARNAGVWSQQAITASDGDASDTFGSSVAIEGNTLVVGAQGHDLGAADQGSAYVYVRSPQTGPPGAQGPAGPIGPQGPLGPIGPVGPEGLQGPQGPQGPQGDQGPQGTVGPAGVDGISIAPIQEAPGPNCANGGQKLTPVYLDGDPAGPPAYVCNGTQGPAGPQGAAGATGPPGAHGDAGPVGPQGRQGPQGSPGAAGPTGAQGPQGEIGPPGATGNQGPPGPAGPIGAQGPQGPAGPTGAQGVRGPQGVAGPEGAQYPGSLLMMLEGTPPPPGYTRIGVFVEERIDPDGRGGQRPTRLRVVLWVKQ